LPSFGEKLKQEREKRNITLEQISASTKIGTRMLQALEEDKFNQLPGGIFNKGFVRAYSRCVGLDEDQIVADYLQASGDGLRTEPAVRDNDAPGIQEKSRNKEQARIHDRVRDRIQEKVQEKNERAVLRLESSAETPSRQLPWGLFAAILLLVALTLALWNRRHEEHERKSNPSASQSSTSAVAPVAPSAGMAQEKAAASTFSGSPAAGRTASAGSKTQQVSEQLSAASGEFTVVVQAREDCWISFTADGKTLSSELLAAGAERTVRGRKEIVVKAGNAGGVDFQFNGKKVDLQADYGEVRTVTFGPGGMSRNAPPPTPQP
jgi:cytoskeleton protein RodZ